MILNGQAIKKARTEIRIGNKKMTLDDLREEFKRRGIKRSYSIVWGWENGEQPQDPEIVAEKLGDIFKKKKEYFLIDDPKVSKRTVEYKNK